MPITAFPSRSLGRAVATEADKVRPAFARATRTDGFGQGVSDGVDGVDGVADDGDLVFDRPGSVTRRVETGEE